MVATAPDREKYVIGDASDHVGFLNCERISERSHIHGWTVEPHFHEGLAQLFVFGDGRVRGLIDTARHDIDGPALVWMPEMVPHAFDYPPDMRGWVLTLPSGSVARLAEEMPWVAAWIRAPHLIVGAYAEPFASAAQPLAHMALAEMRRMDSASNAVLESLFRLLLTQCHRAVVSAPDPVTRPRETRIDLLARFQGLLDQDQGIRSVADYADMLGVTTTHLSRRTKAITGRTAGDMIADRVLLEAKRKLMFTDLTVSEIAYALGFSSPSYFTRFFTKTSGSAPSTFRTEKRAGTD